VITFEDARRIVADLLASTWTPERGTLYVAPDGWEDDVSWRVEAGAREALVEDDPAFRITPGLTYLVDKATGIVEPVPALGNFDRLAAMRRVASPGPWRAWGDGWSLSWSPPDVIEGTPREVAHVLRVLAEGDFVRVTTTGPAIPARVEDPAAVLVALAGLHPDPPRMSGDVPDLVALWRSPDCDDPDVVF